MVVILVLLLATGVVVPSFTRFQKQAQFDWTLRRTLAFATEARGLAISTEHPVALSFNAPTHSFRLLVEPGEQDGDEDATSEAAPPAAERSSPELRMVPVPPDVEVLMQLNGAEAGAPLRFYPDGRADAATIRLEREEHDPVALEVNPRTGRLHVTEAQP